MASKKGEWGGDKTVYFTRLRLRTHGGKAGKRGYDKARKRQEGKQEIREAMANEN